MTGTTTGWQTFLTADTSAVDCYKLITGLAVPRPIGWIGTLSGEGVPNLAPYSFFNAISGDPPMVVFSAGAGVRKDSAANARETGEFTVNVVTEEVAEAMNATSATVEAEVDEFVHAGLTAVPGLVVAAPRVAEAKAQMECTVTDVLKVGRPEGGNWLVVGEVVAFHVAGDLLDGTRVDQARLKAVGRHAGNWYSHATDLFEMVRPAEGSPIVGTGRGAEGGSRC
jgi:flavin reductase (DIM6/NTAB) family NADH-FMN oxidoreductase RutF